MNFMKENLSLKYGVNLLHTVQGWVVQKPINTNPGLDEVSINQV